MQQDPFKDYGLLQYLSDMQLQEVIKRPLESAKHGGFPEHFSNYYKRMNPSDKRTDRSIMDMAINFAGGYDAAARGFPKDSLMRMARHYQSRDYDERPQDSIQDYYENIAGVEAYDPNVGRLSMEDLYRLAMQYAKEKHGSIGQ